MTATGGPAFALVGALAALPRRLAAREVAARGGVLRHGITRDTTHVVLGRRLLAREEEAGLRARLAAARGLPLLAERDFLRRIGLMPPAPAAPAGLTAAALATQSGLAPADVGLLAAFDAFEADAPAADDAAQEAGTYGLRDLILARKYAGLLAAGAGVAAILRALHRSGNPLSLTSRSLEIGAGGSILARDGDALAELDGQFPLSLAGPAEDADDLFARAEAADAAGEPAAAAALYARCLALDPEDATAAFNRGNCLAAAGRPAEAEHEHLRALKIDPGLVEARFNLAALLGARGRDAAARGHLTAALDHDPGYADAAFNLGLLEYKAGNFTAAAALFRRYVALDPGSEWAATARRALYLIGLEAGRA